MVILTKKSIISKNVPTISSIFSTPRPTPYESRFPAQNAPIISSITSIFLADNKCDFDPKRCSKGSKK